MQHMHIIAYKKQLKIIAINTSRLLNPHQGDRCFNLSKHQCFGVDSDRYIGDEDMHTRWLKCCIQKYIVQSLLRSYGHINGFEPSTVNLEGS